MNVLFLCEGTTVPASRFRVGQFVPHFERHGIRCDVRYAYGDRYNRLSRTRLGGPYKLLTRLKRIPFAADADEFDLCFVQRPALPQSALPERLLAEINPRIVFDFDDSIHLGPGGTPNRRREQTLRRNVAIARRVFAGNEYLASLADAPQKTIVIPTVIDTDVYVPSPRSSDGPLVIGWMGTSGNFPFLERVRAPVERALDALDDAVVRLVSNADFEPWADHPQVEQIRWSAEREVSLLQSFDIGLMPLVDGPLTRGKCAFKMIQYMAVGTPVVVSAVGANVEVFENSDAGFCVSTFDAFTDAIVSLGRDAKARRERGEAGRRHTVERYSIRAVLPRYLDCFEAVADR